MKKYRIYIDEVGNSDLQSADNPNERFLSLTGVIVDLAYVKSALHPQMEKLKGKFFHHHPDEPVIFHRKELVNKKHPFEKLRDIKIEKEFNEELCSLLASWCYTVITVLIDKKSHQETYTTWRYNPYHYAMSVMLERYTFFLENQKCKGDVLAESRGGKEDRRLKDSFSWLLKKGTPYLKPERFKEALTSKQLKIKTKQNNISGLQLADLIAHPSRREILREKGFEKYNSNVFGDRIIAILAKKYYKDEEKMYGKKILP